MSDLDAAIAALAQQMSQTLLALSQDGDTSILSGQMDALNELSQDVAVLAEDPASPPTFAGWVPDLVVAVPDDISGLFG